MKNLIPNRSVVSSISARPTLAALVGLLFLAGGCGSSSSTNPSSPSSTAPCVVGQVPTNPECVNPSNLLTVTIKNGVFSPNPVMVTVGQDVNWLNSDGIAHTATDPGVFDTGVIDPGSAHGANGDGVAFNTVGTFNYYCTIHPNETASVVVTNSAPTLGRETEWRDRVDPSRGSRLRLARVEDTPPDLTFAAMRLWAIQYGVLQVHRPSR